MNRIQPPTKEKHTFLDFLYWLLVVSVPVVTAAVAMYRASVAWFVLYLLLGAGLGLVLMRVFCSHCPHYTTGSRTLQCMFFRRIPKLFQERPGPLKMWEKAVTLVVGAVLLLLLPLPGLLEQPALLAVYVLSLAVFLLTVRRYECVRCTFTECPSNRASEEPQGTVS